MNLRRMLAGVVEKYGEKTVIVSGDRRLSYQDLDTASDKLANAFKNLGVNKSDRIALMLSNNPEFIITCFAVFKLGAIVVPLDPKYKKDELDSLIGDCLPCVLVTDGLTLEGISSFISGYKSLHHVISLDAFSGDQFLKYHSLLENSSGTKMDVELEPNDTAIIFYTSGASSEPRGVMLSHGNLVKESTILGDGFGQTHRDILMLFALPMYHVFGMVAVMLNAVCRGGSLVIVPGTGLSIGTFMEAIEREKGTMFLGVPYIFALALDMAEKQGINVDLSSLRLCCSSGDFLPVDVSKRFKKLYGHGIIDGLAMTEAVCHVTCMPISGTEKVGSVGKALPGWEVKVVDEEDIDLPCGETGEIIVRGPMMKGYYGNQTATDELIRNGWLHTGDLGKFDADGVLFFSGRKKDIIILKGQNIYPVDIESVLETHPDVIDSAAIGIPDKMRGEIVAAVVQLRKGANISDHEIRKHCLEYLADYKVPKQIIFVDSIPETAGVNDKTALKKQIMIPPLFPETVISK